MTKKRGNPSPSQTLRRPFADPSQTLRRPFADPSHKLSRLRSGLRLRASAQGQNDRTRNPEWPLTVSPYFLLCHPYFSFVTLRRSRRVSCGDFSLRRPFADPSHKLSRLRSGSDDVLSKAKEWQNSPKHNFLMAILGVILFACFMNLALLFYSNSCRDDILLRTFTNALNLFGALRNSLDSRHKIHS